MHVMLLCLPLTSSTFQSRNVTRYGWVRKLFSCKPHPSASMTTSFPRVRCLLCHLRCHGYPGSHFSKVLITNRPGKLLLFIHSMIDVSIVLQILNMIIDKNFRVKDNQPVHRPSIFSSKSVERMIKNKNRGRFIDCQRKGQGWGRRTFFFLAILPYCSYRTHCACPQVERLQQIVKPPKV